MSEQDLLALLGLTEADLAQLEMLSFIALLATVVAIALTLWLARRKGLNMGFWTLMAFIFGPLALIVLLFVPAKQMTEKDK